METKTKTVDYVKSPQGKQIAIPKVEMPYGNVLVSAEKIDVLGYEGLEIADDQVVVAVSENSWLKVGDIVRLDFYTFRYNSKPGKNDVGTVREIIIPYDEIDKRKYLYLKDSQFKFKIKK